MRHMQTRQGSNTVVAPNWSCEGQDKASDMMRPRRMVHLLNDTWMDVRDVPML